MKDKKIRFTIPNFVNEILFRDIENFDLKINNFFNRIFSASYTNIDKYPFKKNSENKKIQFNMNNKNKAIYENLLSFEAKQNESSYFRDLIRTYISQPFYQRERIIFKSEYDTIKRSIQKKEEVLLEVNEKNILVEPYFFKVTLEEKNNFLFCWNYEEQKYEVYSLSRISKITPVQYRKNTRYYNSEYMKKVVKNFDPFLSYGSIIKVRLTPQGEEWLKRINHFKPTLIKKEKNIYYFESSDRKAILYFSRFYNEAEILEPSNFRLKMKDLLNETLLLYK
ncbi:MAG: WYL domain-containing protein [Psychrilyobacter sp.]|nr:WYL domain-containing protein [Psychrilyobacter sp.]